MYYDTKKPEITACITELCWQFLPKSRGPRILKYKPEFSVVNLAEPKPPVHHHAREETTQQNSKPKYPILMNKNKIRMKSLEMSGTRPKRES